MNRLASVSLDRPLDRIAQELARSFSEYGFALVRDHGIDEAVTARAERAMRAFFALPEEVKRTYCLAGLAGARGFTPFGIERAKGAEHRDLKEFWHIGRDLPPGHALARYMPANVWPAQVPDFEPAMRELFAAFERAGLRLLQAIALGLGLERDGFAASVAEGNSVLRLLHYPPVAEDEQGSIRAAPHEDINAITLLLGAEEAGLELLTTGGEWLPVTPEAGSLVVNIGDMMQRLTAGRLRSTTHRVVNPAGPAAARSRYSMPFFLHFRPNFVIAPLGESGEEPITADDFLQQRLREINLA